MSKGVCLVVAGTGSVQLLPWTVSVGSPLAPRAEAPVTAQIMASSYDPISYDPVAGKHLSLESGDMDANTPLESAPALGAASRAEAAKALLVVIANYGTKNDAYLNRLLAEFRSMSHRVHVVVLTNVPKSFGADVEVIVEQPHGNPRSFPFAHRQILAQRADDYDIFIYSEDDTLIAEKNIDAFLQATKVLPPDEIAGFLRTEVGTDGRRYFSTVHSHFHWEPGSACRRGEHVFAYFSNEHSACYVLTREQLKRAIASGGYLVGPHEGKYQMLETAATDPYTACGMRKMICISHFDNFVLPHLPNKYIGVMGLEESEVQYQVQALLAIARGERAAITLLEVETKALHQNWSKGYHEPCNYEALSLVPPTARSILSVGCGQGLTERALIERGYSVVGLPLDSVISTCAEARGVQVVLEKLQTVASRFNGDQFDCVLVLNVLHLLPDPISALTAFGSLLGPGGRILVGLPNFSYLPYFWGRLRRDPRFANLGSYEESGLHSTTPRMVRGWFKQSKLATETIVNVVPERWQRLRRPLGGLTNYLFGSELIAVARKEQ